MITVTRRLEWDSGHRVLGHGGRCRHLHGHRYVAEITVTATDLNECGFVIDFAVIKERVGKWIYNNWDHNLLLNSADPALQHLTDTEERTPFVFDNENPTAENMSVRLAMVASELLPSLKVVSVRVYETPNCWADYLSVV